MWISLKISLKFVPKVRINNIPELVQIMAWRWPDNKPLSEPMMVSLLTHICVTQPQWVNCCCDMYKAVQQLLHYYYYTSIWIYMEWKGCESDVMLDPLWNLELWPQQWLGIGFLDFQGQILVVVYKEGMVQLIWNKRNMNQQDDGYPVWPYPWPWPWILKAKFWK